MGQRTMSTFNHATETFISLCLLLPPSIAACSSHDLNIALSLLRKTEERLNLMRLYSDTAATFQTSAWCNITDECLLSLSAPGECEFLHNNILENDSSNGFLTMCENFEPVSHWMFAGSTIKKHVHHSDEMEITSLIHTHLEQKRFSY